jgi:hypothetical protein
MAMGLLYMLTLWSNLWVMWGLLIHWFHDLDATILNGSVTTGRTSLVSVGHSGSDPIVPLMLHTVCCTMARALALYYRSLEIASTLLRRGNISYRPYCWTMTIVDIICMYHYYMYISRIIKLLWWNCFCLINTRVHYWKLTWVLSALKITKS